jgi:plasmid stabilization system protein ParE
LENADRVLEQLHAAFARLARTPGMGHHREDLADRRHCFWTVYSYVVAYRDQATPLEIIAIVHGARRWEAFFQRRIGGRFRGSRMSPALSCADRADALTVIRQLVLDC